MTFVAICSRQLTVIWWIGVWDTMLTTFLSLLRICCKLMKRARQLITAVWTVFHFGSSERQQILDWVATRVAKPPSDLRESWRDGILLCALADSLLPGCCPRPDLLDSQQEFKNVTLALKIIEKHFGITPEMTAQEIVSGLPETDRKLLSLLSQMRQKDISNSNPANRKRSMKSDFSYAKQREILNDSVDCSAKGIGLVVGFVGRKARFNIFCKSLSALDIVIEIRGPTDTMCCERITNRSPKKKNLPNNTFTRPRSLSEEGKVGKEGDKKKKSREILLEYELLDRQISVGYTPLQTGQHKLTILWHGQNIPGSPYSVSVEDSFDIYGDSSPIHIRPIMPWKEVTECWDKEKNNYDRATKNRSLRKTSVRFKEPENDKPRWGKVIRRRVLRYILKLNGKEVIVDARSSEMLAPALQNLIKEDEGNPFGVRRNSWGFVGDIHLERKRKITRQFSVDFSDVEGSLQRRVSLSLPGSYRSTYLPEGDQENSRKEIFNSPLMGLHPVAERTDGEFYVDENSYTLNSSLENENEETSPTPTTSNDDFAEDVFYGSESTRQDSCELISNSENEECQKEEDILVLEHNNSEPCSLNINHSAENFCESSTESLQRNEMCKESEGNGCIHLPEEEKSESNESNQGDQNSNQITGNDDSESVIENEHLSFRSDIEMIKENSHSNMHTNNAGDSHSVDDTRRDFVRNSILRMGKRRSNPNRKENSTESLTSTEGGIIDNRSVSNSNVQNIRKHRKGILQKMNTYHSRTEKSQDFQEPQKISANSIKREILRSNESDGFSKGSAENVSAASSQDADSSETFQTDLISTLGKCGEITQSENYWPVIAHPMFSLGSYKDKENLLLKDANVNKVDSVKDIIKNLHMQCSLLSDYKLGETQKIGPRKIYLPALSANEDRVPVKSRIKEWEKTTMELASERQTPLETKGITKADTLPYLESIQSKLMFWENTCKNSENKRVPSADRCLDEAKVFQSPSQNQPRSEKCEYENEVKEKSLQEDVELASADRSTEGNTLSNQSNETFNVSSLKTLDSDITEDSGISDALNIKTNQNSMNNDRLRIARRRMSDPGWTYSVTYQGRKLQEIVDEVQDARNGSVILSEPDLLGVHESSGQQQAEDSGDEYIDDEIPDYVAMFLEDYVSFTGLINVEGPHAQKECVILDCQSTGMSFDQPLDSAISWPRECLVYGIGVYYGYVAVKNLFQVLTKDAGRGNLSVSIRGSGLHDVTEVSVIYRRNDVYDVIYQVTEPGYYVISVRWSDWSVPGSPFICKVTY